MIRVTMTNDSLCMRGHAKAAESLAHSRACAAATMLAFTMGDAVEEAVSGVTAKVRSGYFKVLWPQNAVTDGIANVIAAGYRRLGGEYPMHVKFEDKRG